MDVVSLCPLRAWGFVWQSQDGRFAQTVVVKATFVLAPGQAVLAPEQEAPNEEDGHWDDDPARSVVAPSDKAPYKPRADVMLVGHAYAPGKQPTRSVMVRMIVGELDKSIEVWCDRRFRLQDGHLLEGPRFTKMPLRWERAAGGPESSNPVGMPFDAAPDAYGMVAIPNLQPPGMFVAKRSDTFAPVCFAPLAANWPGRTQRLAHLAGMFPQPGWEERPLPAGLALAFFQAAPLDQQVEQIRPNERIVLENLHPEHARLVTRLPDVRPRVVAERATGEREEVALVADTLWIDTDRGVCVVVWRGRIGLRHAQEVGRIAVTAQTIQNEETAEALPPSIAPVSGRAEEREPVSKPTAMTLTPGIGSALQPVMPFVGTDSAQSAPRASTPRTGDGALPFGQGGAAALRGMPRVEPQKSPPDSISELRNEGLPFASGARAVEPPAPAAVPWSFAQPAPVVPSAPPSAPQEPSSPWAAGPPPSAAALAAAAPLPVIAATNPASSGRPGSAVAASDAAAEVQARQPTPAAQTPAKPLSSASTGAKAQRVATNEVLDLLWYEESFVPRIRSVWEELVTELDFEPADPRQDLGAEDPEKARSRHNVFGILSDGEMVEPAGISQVVTDAVNQKGRFTPPLTLTGGELRFPFDEVETLKATIVAMTPFLGTDKRLKENVDAMNELLETPYLQGSTGVVEKLLRDLRTQFRDSNRSLPATYLDGHVERLLLEQRRYAIRKVFGGEFIRALLSTPGIEGGAIPVYLPKQLEQVLPMLVVMKVRLIVEAHLQQDPYDTSPYALRTVALGRSYQLDALRGSSKSAAS